MSNRDHDRNANQNPGQRSGSTKPGQKDPKQQSQGGQKPSQPQDAAMGDVSGSRQGKQPGAGH